MQVQPRATPAAGFTAGVVTVAVVGAALAILGFAGRGLGLHRLAHGWPRMALVLVGSILVLAAVARGLRHTSAAARPLAAGRVLAVAIAMGLIAGFAEDVMQVPRTWVFERGLDVHPHLYWMKPLANALLFAALGAALIVAGRFWRAVVSAWMVCGLLGFAAAFGVVRMIPGLHALAAAVLAGGVGVVLARSAAAAAGLPARLARTVPWSLALVVVVGLASWVPRVMAERAAQSRLPPAPAGAPNVLLIVWDTVRAESLSLHGHGVPTTPHLQRLAAHGVAFDRALSTAPWTLPSHASMFTGRLPHQVFRPGETPLNAMTPVREEHLTLAEVLSERGWSTAGFVGNLGYCSRAHGLAQGFAHYEDYPVDLGWLFASPWLGGAAIDNVKRWLGDPQEQGRRNGADVEAAFFGWLDQRDGPDQARPFFAFLNLFDAHRPYLPPPPFDRFALDTRARPLIEMIVPHKIAQLHATYEGCIAYLDSLLGSLVAELQRRNLLDNTLIVVTSDHGEQLGERGLFGHANALYPQLLHVPLVLSLPGRVPAGVRVPQLVSLVNLAATIQDVLGLQGTDLLPGESFARHWQQQDGNAVPASGQTVIAEEMIGDRPPGVWNASWPGYDGGLRALYVDEYAYIRALGSRPREELFHFGDDQRCVREIGSTPAGKVVLEQLRRRLDQLLR